ncbi:MAG: hypothetical protein HUK00_10645 [Bacteroidaceae bacterium]|nr:hypothetical protein [Bacteroidaceae bacterium]
MHSFNISRLKDIAELSGFRCGVAAIDDIISHCLPDTMADSGRKIYVVRREGEETVISIFVLSHGDLELDTIDLNEIKGDYSDVDDSDIRRYHYDALEIDLLAVRESERYGHIGRHVIEIIKDNRQRLGFEKALFILVDAYFEDGYNAIPFYDKCGFRRTFQHATIDTCRMFLPII